ncbi:MAG: TRAP transporter permease, partial [Candidatus Puniceispirillum sp.]
IAFPALKHETGGTTTKTGWGRIAGVPLYDCLFIVCGIAASLYIGITWYEIKFTLFGIDFFLPEQVLRQGAPLPIDVVFGSILVLVLLEAVRRTIGIVV